MGGGASAVRDMEEIVACTFLIGKAIAAVSFPGKIFYRRHLLPCCGTIRSTTNGSAALMH